MAKGTAIMIQGCTSDSGKSLITMALCRYLSNQGFKVVPFKAQNMSNNARVVAGGEIGTAQWLQAKAARVTPDVRMNPILLKPQSDANSQVIVLGQVHFEYSQMDWRGRSKLLWPIVQDSLENLLNEYEIVVIEGAGSPAEINLASSDIVNMRVAEAAVAKVLLVADIDRGGAFAHLLGTHSLLHEHQQKLIAGFILNKFRGDPELLAPGPEILTKLTGMKFAGIIPFFHHAIPDEEGPSLHISSHSRKPKNIQVVCGPYASNLDEFSLLQQVCNLTWVRSPEGIQSPDFLILPGSKNSAADLAWMRGNSLDKSITELAKNGVPILGICGGTQILGLSIKDEVGIESEGPVDGLGLLDIVTELLDTKRVVESSLEFPLLAGCWSWLSRKSVEGYEVRFGSSKSRNGTDGQLEIFHSENILGIYMHGLFENEEVVHALTGVQFQNLDDSLDDLTENIMAGIDAEWLATFIPQKKWR